MSDYTAIRDASKTVFRAMSQQSDAIQFANVKIGVSLPVSAYSQGVIDSCKFLLRWTRDEINAYRHGRKFRGRYPARYAGR